MGAPVTMKALEAAAAELSEAFGRQFVIQSRTINEGEVGQSKEVWLAWMVPGQPLIYLAGPTSVGSLLAGIRLVQQLHEREILFSSI